MMDQKVFNNLWRRTFILGVLFVLLIPSHGFSHEKLIEKSAVVKAHLDEVWNAWTSLKGMGEFFTPNGNIKLEKGGPYELYLIEGAPEGQRGSDGCRLLSYVPMKMLSFEWGIPPKFKELREKYQTRTWIVLLFDKMADDKVKVTLYHLGFGDGKEWDEVYSYFDKAWDFVLERLKMRFETGPLNWNQR